MIGDWVKAERKRRGWSQAELARRSELTQQAIYLLESHQRSNPSGQTLAKLARAFDVGVDELMQTAAVPTPNAPTDPPGGRLEDWLREISDIGPALTSAQRLAVLEHARALARAAD
jgi:transcriptional regulator with XRE-family HTH domain